MYLYFEEIYVTEYTKYIFRQKEMQTLVKLVPILNENEAMNLEHFRLADHRERR